MTKMQSLEETRISNIKRDLQKFGDVLQQLVDVRPLRFVDAPAHSRSMFVPQSEAQVSKAAFELSRQIDPKLDIQSFVEDVLQQYGPSPPLQPFTYDLEVLPDQLQENIRAFFVWAREWYDARGPDTVALMNSSV